MPVLLWAISTKSLIKESQAGVGWKDLKAHPVLPLATAGWHCLRTRGCHGAVRELRLTGIPFSMSCPAVIPSAGEKEGTRE